MVLGGPVVFSWRGQGSQRGALGRDIGELNVKGEPCWDVQGGKYGRSQNVSGLECLVRGFG